MQHLQKVAGGVQLAADLIEHASWYGVNHLATADSYQTFWQFHDLDILLVQILFSIPVALLLWNTCRGSEKQGRRPKLGQSGAKRKET